MSENQQRTFTLRLVAAIAVIAVAAVTTATWAWAQRGDGGRPHHPQPHTVVVFETDATETLHDRDGDGFTAGDMIIERATLVDPDTGEQVGQAVEDIRIVGVAQPPNEDDPLGDWELVMDATFVLEDGNLTFGGYGTIGDFAADGAEFAIRGGTGTYDGASGTATVVLSEVGGEAGPLITFELTPG